MIVNKDNKSVDIEQRDWNYVMTAYVRNYLFVAKNESPEKIVFPMFRTVKHPFTGVDIPVEWMPEDSPVAVDIKEEGSTVEEATEAEIVAVDKKDKEVAKLKEQITEPEEQVATVTPAPEDLIRQQEESVPEPEPESPARAAFKDVPDREPKTPDVVIPPGSQLDNMSKRDKADQRRIARDLAEQPDIDEEKEKPFDKAVERDEKGEPVVKDNK